MPRVSSLVQRIHFEDFGGTEFERLVSHITFAPAGPIWLGTGKQAVTVAGTSSETTCSMMGVGRGRLFNAQTGRHSPKRKQKQT